MAMPFHFNIPSWILKYTSNQKCHKCKKHSMKKQDVISIGIRQLNKQETTPFIEVCCPLCESRMLISFGGHMKGNIEEVCYAILNQVQQRKVIKASSESKSVSKLKMTNREINTFLKKTKKMQTHEDFMKEIGAFEHFKNLKKNAD